MITKNYINDLSYKVVGCAIEVHRYLGPGLLEAVYHECLFDELQIQGISVKTNVSVPIHYKGKLLCSPLYIDLLVENQVILELKTVEKIHPVYKAQLLSYMKLAEKPKGLLINFHTDNIVSSMTPMVNDIFKNLPD